MAIHEDRTAAKLKGHNCLIKFIDGEELTFKVEELDSRDPIDAEFWFKDVEKFINGCDEGTVEYFPLVDLAVRKDMIKYVIPL